VKRLFLCFCVLEVLLSETTSATAGIDYVYLTSGEFGTMNLSTGQFTPIGPASATYEDLARLPGGPLYGVDSSGNLLNINPATGTSSSTIGNMGTGIEGAKLNGGGAL
jgi:hypothetical protein